MRRASPFFEHGGNLRDEKHIRSHSTNHKIVSDGVRKFRFLVSTDALVLLAAHFI